MVRPAIARGSPIRLQCLEAQVVSLPLPVFASGPWMPEVKLSKSKAGHGEKLNALHDELRLKVGPLTRVASYDDLEAYLRLTRSEITGLANQTAFLTMESAPNATIADLETKAKEILKGFADARPLMTDLVGPEHAERLMAALSSQVSFVSWYMRRLRDFVGGDAKAFYRPPVLSSEAGSALEKAWIVLYALNLVLAGKIKTWSQRGLQILAEAMDTYMGLVEDEFLAAKPISPSKTVSGESVAHVVKLRT